MNSLSCLLILAALLTLSSLSVASAQTLDEAQDCFLRGDWAGQAKALHEYLGTHPSDTTSWFEYATALNQQKNYSTSIRAYTSIINLDPKRSEAWLGRANANFWSGKYRESLQDCNEGLKLRSDDCPLLRARANAEEKLGSISEAISDVTRVIDSKYRLNFFDNLVYRASLYRVSGNLDLAVADCTRCLVLMPSDQNALRERAEDYELLGMREKSQDDRETLATAKAHTFTVGGPTQTIIDGKTGAIIASSGATHNEKRNEDRAKLQKPEVPDTVPDGLNQKQYYKLTAAYGWARAQDTLLCIDKINAINASSEIAVKANRLKDVLLPKQLPAPHEAVELSKTAMDLWAKDPGKAMVLAKLCVAKFPNFEYGYITLGSLEKDKGELDAARDAFEKALSINPHNVQALSRLGNVLRNTDKEQAKKILRTAVRLAPDDSFDRYVLFLMGDEQR